MVKRIKKAQKSLVLTTSPRSYWFNSCIHTRRSLRGGVGYSSRPDVTFLTFLDFPDFRIMPKRLKRTDFSLCEESKRRKAVVEQQINSNIAASSVDEDLVRIIFYLILRHQ